MLIAIAMSAVRGRFEVMPRTKPSPARRQVVERAVPSQGNRMRFGEKLFTVDESDLEVRKGGIEPTPEATTGLVAVHVLREGRLRQLLVATLEKVGPVRVTDDVHERLSNATA